MKYTSITSFKIVAAYLTQMQKLEFNIHYIIKRK